MDAVVTQVTAIVGAVTGIAGLVLAAFQAFWDRPRLLLAAYREQNCYVNPDKVRDVISVIIANGGRRPAIVVSLNLVSKKGQYGISPGFNYGNEKTPAYLPAILNPPHFIVVRLSCSGLRGGELDAIEIQDSLNKKHFVPKSYIGEIRKSLSDSPYSNES